MREEFTFTIKGVIDEVDLVPGVVVAVVLDDAVVYAHGFGYRDLEQRDPVEIETIF